jgi:hypothetical protein
MEYMNAKLCWTSGIETRKYQPSKKRRLVPSKWYLRRTAQSIRHVHHVYKRCGTPDAQRFAVGVLVVIFGRNMLLLMDMLKRNLLT